MRPSLMAASSLAGLAMACSFGTDSNADVESSYDNDCHIDCFGDTRCAEGVLNWNVYAPVPCSDSTDFSNWEAYCETNHVAYTCPIQTCGESTLMSRYAPLGVPWSEWTPRATFLFALFCGGDSKHAGDSCGSDSDCRPAGLEVVGRLTCDGGTCREVPRPAAPAAFGQSCGLPAHSGSRNSDGLMPGNTCDYCHIVDKDGCDAQACTMPCEFDEDCPTGAFCAPSSLCDFFCVVDDGTSRGLIGRTQWLKCPGADAGM